MNTRHHNAFSLLEILIAIGLFAVVITGLLTLFPVALRTEKSGEDETRATLIASGVMEALQSGDGIGPLSLATGMSNGIPVWEMLQTNVSVSYNASCEPIQSLSAKEAVLPVVDPAAATVVTLSLVSKPSMPGILTAEVAVASPASAPAANRSIQKFVRLILSPSR